MPSTVPPGNRSAAAARPGCGNSRFETVPCEHSYGFRPKKSAHDAIDTIADALWQGQTQIIDADLSKYFDSIPHAKLMVTVAARIVDGAVLALIKQWLKAPIMSESDSGKTVHPARADNLQTPAISPLSSTKPRILHWYISWLTVYFKTKIA